MTHTHRKCILCYCVLVVIFGCLIVVGYFVVTHSLQHGATSTWHFNIGYLLLQQHCTCDTAKAPICCNEGWKLILAGFRCTNTAEQGYSPTEGEALAVSWGLQHARLFTQGCPHLFVTTDHKPLLGLFNTSGVTRG